MSTIEKHEEQPVGGGGGGAEAGARDGWVKAYAKKVKKLNVLEQIFKGFGGLLRTL